MKRTLFTAVFVLVCLGSLFAQNQPRTAEEYVERGVAYLESKDYGKAKMDFTEAIRLDPNYADAYYRRGMMYLSWRDFFDKAITDFEAACRINPNHRAKGMLEYYMRQAQAKSR